MTKDIRLENNSDGIDLVYIVSTGHSGSTLLDILLNNHPGIQSVGEIMFFDEWVEKDNLCSCGEYFNRCPFWIEIRRQLPEDFKLEGGVSSRSVNLFAQRVVSMPEAYNKHSYQLFKAIKKYSGKSIIVDSSKSIGRLKYFLMSDMFKIKIVHLVRNGMAVVNSLGKRHSRPAVREPDLTARQSAVRASLRWVMKNRSLERMVETDSELQYHRLRYEDLCRSTEDTMSDLCNFLGIVFHPDMTRLGEIEIHNIAGSRWRFRGRTDISTDEQWVREFSLWKRVVFAAIGKRMNRRYGY